MLVIETWDGHNINDGTNYRAGFSPAELWGLPKVGVNSVQRVGAWPLFGALQRNPTHHSIFIAIQGAAIRTLRAQLLRWFDPEDETPKQLVITDDGTLRPRYLNAVCQQLRPVIIGNVAAFELFRADLVVSGDVKWRGTADDTDVWAITVSGDTNVVANDGEDDSYPVYKIKPTSGKTGGYDYRVWVPVKWRSENAASAYPVVAVMDTATPIGAAKMQADGDDLRVLSDGVEIRRWLNDINTGTTDIWFSLDFTRAPSLILKTAIAGAGAITSIEFTDEVEVSLLPETGIIYIGTEALVYTARSLIDGAVTGITRGAKGTSLGAHNPADICYWIQHDVYILYGNAAATDPAVGNYDRYSPAFDIPDETLSNNTQWHYLVFGERFFPRAAAWTTPQSTFAITGNGGTYGVTERGIDFTNPFSVIGAWRGGAGGGPTGAFSYFWQLYNPCGIVDVAWADGKMRAADKDAFHFSLRYWVRGAGWWSNQYLRQGASNPLAADDTWYAWSQAAGVDWDPADVIALINYGSSFLSDFEAGTVTVFLQAAEVPVVAVGSEQGNYELSATLTNQATGEAITLNFVMDLNSELEVDTYNKVITWLEDDSRQYQAISFSSERRHWLRLEPGNNTLEFVDVGTGNVTLTTVQTPRYY